MKKYYALLLLCLFTVISTNAQGYNFGDVKKIEEKIDQIRKDGKNELKLKLKAVSERLKNKEITKIQADKLKDSLKTESKKQTTKKVNIEFKKIEKLYENREKLREESKFSHSKIGKAITTIIVEEKIALKKAVEQIDARLSKNEITLKEADSLKIVASEKHASEIEKKISNEYAKIQEFTDKQIAYTDIDSVLTTTYYGNPKNNNILYVQKTSKTQLKQYKKNLPWFNKYRTNNQGAIMFGTYNVVNNGKFSTDYKTWQSTFYGYGHSWKYRLSENFSPFYIKFGSSILFNNLRATDNRYFVKNNRETRLATHTKDLKVARLKNVQLIFPVHFQIDFSKPHYVDGAKSYADSHRESFRLGLGGYAGFRIHSRQILKYEENGNYVKEKQNDNYNLNNFTYGLSAYFGYRSTALYAKYDINTLFKNGNGRGVSLGLRLEI